MKELRKYQAEAIKSSEKALSKGIWRQMLVLCTGAGKTFTAVKTIAPFKKRLWCTHTEELMEQSGQAFISELYPDINLKTMIDTYGGLTDYLKAVRNHGLFADASDNDILKNIGIIKAEAFNIESDIVLASAQTLHRRLDKIRPDMFDAIVADECHYFGSTTFVKSLNHFQPKLLLGLTATPYRQDGTQLADIFDEIIYQYNLLDAIQDGYLCELDAIQIKTNLSLDAIRTVGGEFNQKDLKETVDTPARNRLLVEKYRQYANGKQNIVFCVDVEHAKNVLQTFREAGENADIVVGDESITSDRKGVINRFKNGEITHLINVMILTAGFDHPNVGCVTLACIDEKTEILTKDGWKGINDDIIDVISYNTKTKQLENTLITGRIEKFWDEGMVRLDSGQYDLNVTTNHRMLVGLGRRNNDYCFTNAENLIKKERFRLPISATGMTQGVNLSDNELRFIAWFMTDGGFVGGRKSIGISQAKEKTKKIIKQLLIDLNYRFQEYTYPNTRSFGGEKALPLTSFRIPKGEKGAAKGKGWKKLLPFLDKNLSNLLMNMSKRQFIIFWNELLLGDGNNDSRVDRRQQLIICNDIFLSRLQATAIMCGFATNATYSQYTSKGNKIWYMSISERRFIEIKTNDKRSSSPSVYINREKSQKVWCVENKNKTIIVRRNGSVAIIGNCPTKSKTKFIQQIGRGSRTLPGVINGLGTSEDRIKAIKASEKPKCVVLDIVDTTSKHRIVNTWSLDKELPVEQRVFTTQEKKDKMLEARKKREFESITKKDTRVDLFKLPKVKLSNSIKMKDPATEKQLSYLKALGYDIETTQYTKGDANEILSNESATEKQIKLLKWKGYDTSNGVTRAEAKLAFDEITAREQRQKEQNNLNKNLPIDDVF